MKKTLGLLLAFALLVSALAGCGGSGSSGSAPAASAPDVQAGPESTGDASAAGDAAGGDVGTFTVALGSDIVSLDPAFAYDFTTNPVVNQITEGLLTFDQNNQLIPMLAKEWTLVDDTTYVYTIRDDVTFSDGTPMTMDDVLFSLERSMSPDTGSYLQWMFEAVDTIEATGDWELTVKLKQPSASWQYVLATTAGHIISKAYYEAHVADFGNSTGGMLGTGAFVYDSWKSGQEIVLQKNPNYWNKDVAIAIDTIVFKIIPEDTTRVTALQTGQVDFTAEPPYDMMDTLMADNNLSVSGVETFGLTYLAFNTQRAPFDDVNVRKAVYSAIDFESIQNNITKTAGSIGTVLPHSKALYTIEPDRWENYLSIAPVYKYDLEAAKEYMAQSSVPDGFSCTLMTTEASLRYNTALAIQEALKAINIDVEIVKLSSDEHTVYQFGGVLDADGKRDYDMIIAGWEADYPDISGNMEPLYAAVGAGVDGPNAAAYVNDEVDGYIRAQAASTNPTERNDMLFKALDIITNDVPYIFINYPVKHSVINKEYTGFTMNASWIWSLRFQDIRPA